MSECGHAAGELSIVSKIVSIARADKPWIYPHKSPFLPRKYYPELERHVRVGDEQNSVYGAFRELCYTMGFAKDQWGTPDWNPLGDIIRPGQKVLVKPNLVRHIHLSGGDYRAVVTHASVVRCVLDYAARALEGRGQITVGDAPIQSADFDSVLSRTGLREVCDDVAETWDIPVRLVDFRLWSTEFDERASVLRGVSRSGDPAGYRWVDLGKRSLLDGISSHADRFRVTCYDPSSMRTHHNADRHEYIVPRTILDADVVLNLPKLKTHRKAGLTAALKNVVGINGHKDCLPHHRCGSPREGGDEYMHHSFFKRLQSWLDEDTYGASGRRAKVLRRFAIRAAGRLGRWMNADPYVEGSWHGNDTLWRTVLDLNRLLVYADREGRMTEIPQRRCFTIVDAIIAGEGEGPMMPDPRPCGLLVGGANPVAVDAVLATLIGFDYSKLPLVANALDLRDMPLVDFQLDDIHIVSADRRFAGLRVGEPYDQYAFRPPSGWQGFVEFPNNGHNVGTAPTTGKRP